MTKKRKCSIKNLQMRRKKLREASKAPRQQKIQNRLSFWHLASILSSDSEKTALRSLLFFWAEIFWEKCEQNFRRCKLSEPCVDLLLLAIQTRLDDRLLVNTEFWMLPWHFCNPKMNFSRAYLKRINWEVLIELFFENKHLVVATSAFSRRVDSHLFSNFDDLGAIKALESHFFYQ